MPMLMDGYRTHGMTQYSTETHGQVECIGGRPRSTELARCLHEWKKY